jgi:K+-transporting ATPase ATPase A chain
MTINGWLQILLFFALILLVTKPLGMFMTRVFSATAIFYRQSCAPLSD